MRVLDLFSGIGGFSLGLERAGMQTVAFSEIDNYCNRVLRKHWPHVPNLGDIRGIEFTAGGAEVICGGFPCQDISNAGKRVESKDSAADYGPNTQDLLAVFDRNSSSWKTSQPCLVEGLTVYSGTWPRSGMMRSGTAYRLPTLARPITGTASGLLPTPSGVNGGKNHTVGRLNEWGGNSNPFRGTEIGKKRCASFEEWMMGFPIGWTELTPSEMQSSRKSRKQ